MIRSAKALLLTFPLQRALSVKPRPLRLPTTKSSAYYNFTMGRIYAELAQAYGNRPEYLNKAVQFYQEALKLDPDAGADLRRADGTLHRDEPSARRGRHRRRVR